MCGRTVLVHLFVLLGSLFRPSSSFAITKTPSASISKQFVVARPTPHSCTQPQLLTAPVEHISTNQFSWLRQSRRSDDEGEVDNESRSRQSTSFLTDRIQNADPLEIRLDATLASIYVLCRFLIYDITTGAKNHPGWEFKDVLWLLQTSSSAILLAALWTGAGLITRIFEDGSYEVNILKVLGTVVLAAPIWLLLEIQFGWPPAGLLYAEGADDMITLVLTGSVGLCSVMLLGKYLTSGWR